MKFLLYVAVSVFVLSVDCAVLRPAANELPEDFNPHFRKRDLTTEQFVEEVISKLEKRDVGKLFPVGGDIISHWVNLIEDLIGQFIPKFGKRDVGKLFPVGGDIISHWVNLIEDFIGQFVPKVGKRDIASLFPVGGKTVSYWVHLIEDLIGQFIPKIGKRDIGSLRVNRAEDLVGLALHYFGKRDLESSMRQERDLMDSIQMANDDLLKPALQSIFDMGQRFFRLLVLPFA